MSTFRRSAFSLVELSIVLVILGLLVGGVLSGQSLIRAAELRAITTEYGKYSTASNTFRDKYFAIPGDMTNATQFWGYKGGTGCTNNSGAATVSTGTCDGNGDGIAGYVTTPTRTAEAFQAWRQLSLAGIIEGSFSGTSSTQDSPDFDTHGGGAAGYKIGTNCPASKVSNVCWGYSYFDNSTGWVTSVFSYDYRNWMTIGAVTSDATDVFADNGFLKAEEAWNIDTKMDDGKPDQGKVQTRILPDCATAGGGVYLLSTTTQSCPLLFSGR